jgi:hypothetical protein
VDSGSSDESELDWPNGSDCSEAENENDGPTVGLNDFKKCQNELFSCNPDQRLDVKHGGAISLDSQRDFLQSRRNLLFCLPIFSFINSPIRRLNDFKKSGNPLLVFIRFIIRPGQKVR